jgi:hypothetical protein
MAEFTAPEFHSVSNKISWIYHLHKGELLDFYPGKGKAIHVTGREGP